MSISSEINRIKDEVETQADLIGQIRSALGGENGDSTAANLSGNTTALREILDLVNYILIPPAEDLDAVLTEQENKIAELKALLEDKAGEDSGGGVTIETATLSFSRSGAKTVNLDLYYTDALHELVSTNITPTPMNSFEVCKDHIVVVRRSSGTGTIKSITTNGSTVTDLLQGVSSTTYQAFVMTGDTVIRVG